MLFFDVISFDDTTVYLKNYKFSWILNSKEKSIFLQTSDNN